MNLSELEYELPELKNDLMSKYSSLLSYMKALIEYIESDSVDEYTINNKINSIVDCIKQLDKLIHGLYNPVFSSFDKLSVRKKVSQYKRELTKISADAENQAIGIKEKLEELENNNIKFNKKEMKFITKDRSGQTIWLETGNSTAGFKHIVERHGNDYKKAFGINKEQIPTKIKKSYYERQNNKYC